MSQQTPVKRVLFPRALALAMAGGFVLFAVLSLVMAARPQIAAAATNNNLNFQARLQAASGNIVPDGYYNVEFKLYNVSSAGTALWSETYYDSNGATAGNDNRVRVANGYLTVNLGSQTAFPNSINWDQDLWITLNIGGTTQTATPTWDGEMNPRLKLTGVPYAFRAGALATYNSASGFTSTLQLLQPTGGNQIFQAADQGAAGTYTLCIQNSTDCGFAAATGGSGYIQNSTALQTANFNISGNGTAATFNATTGVNTGTGAGTQRIDASGNLTNIGNISATGNALFKSATDSATAFQIQNAAGSSAFTVNTTNLSVTLADTVVAAGKSLTLVGGTTSTRPASPSEGTLYYDQTTKQMLTFTNGKWQSYASSAGTKTVAMGTATGCTGTSPVASQNPEGADYVVTSCTSAQTTINTAISALPAGGGTLFLHQGTYIIDGSINLPNNVTLVGDGDGTVIKFKDSMGAGTFQAVTNVDTTSGTQVIIKSLRIEGNRANNATGTPTMYGIFLNGMGGGTGATARNGAKISGTTIRDFRTDAIHLTNSSNNTLSNNALQANGRDGIRMANSSSHNTINGNRSQGNDASGITALGSSVFSNSITGNTVQGNLYGIQTAFSPGNTISGNAARSNSIGIDISNTSNNTVSANNIRENTLYGIRLISSNNNLVSGNQVASNGGSIDNNGIYVQNSDANTITSSDINDSSCTTTCYAINILDATSDNNYLADNRHSGTTANPSTINDAGTGTIYANQTDGLGNLINRGQAGFSIGKTTAGATLDLQGGLRSVQLPTPASPTLTVSGTAGTTVYRYQVTALDGMGETLPSSIVEVTNGNATLSATNRVSVALAPVGGAVQYRIYRCTGTGCTPALLATVASNIGTYQDTANGTPSGALTTANTTGGASIAGIIQATAGINTGAGAGTQRIDASGNLTNIGNVSATGTALFKSATDSATAFQIQNAAASAMLTMNTTSGKLTVEQGGLEVKGIANPATPSLTSVGTGGSLAAATYYYRVAATGPAGETQAVVSSPGSVTTTGTTSVNTLSWTAVANATGYKVYRSTDNSTWNVNSVSGATISITDNGTNFTWSTAGSPNLFANNTGNIQLSVGASLGLGDSSGLRNDNAGVVVLNNYAAGGRIALQGDSLTFEDTTGFNQNFIINNTGSTTFRNRVDSAAAFQVRNAAGNQLLTVDTAGSNVILGKPGASGVDGKLVFNNASNANTVSLNTGVTSASYALTLPTAGTAGAKCLASTAASTAAATALEFITCGSGSATTLQDAYTNSGTADPQILLNGTNGGIKIRDAATPITGNLFSVQNNGATATYLGLTSAALTLQDSAGNNALVFDSATSELRVYENIASPARYARIYYDNTAGQAVFAASSGTTRLGGGAGNIDITTTGTAEQINLSTANTLRWSVLSTGELQGSGASILRSSTGNITIASNGGDGNVVLTPNGLGNVNISAGGLQTGGTTRLDNGGNLSNIGNVTANGTATFRSSTNSVTAFQIQNAAGTGLLNVDTTNGRVGINTVNPQQALDVKGNILVKDADVAGKAFRFRTNGAAMDIEAGGTDLFVSTWSGADFTGTQYNQLTFKNNGNSIDFHRGINFVSGDNTSLSTVFDNLILEADSDNNGVGDLLTIRGNGGVDIAKINNDGALNIKNTANSATAFQVQNAAGGRIFNVNSTTGNVAISQGGLRVDGLFNPGNVTLSSSGTGGSLAAATYHYRVSATGTAGETQAIATSPASVTTSGTTSQNTISWATVSYATGYKVYRSTDGGSTWSVNTIAAGTTSIVDNGTTYTWTTAGTPALFENTTGDIYLQNGATLRLNQAGNSTLKNDAAGNATVLGNYAASGVAIVQADQFQFQDTTGYNANLHINNIGATTFKNRTNSAAAFRVQNAGGTSLFTTDTTNSRIGITSISGAAPSFLLDVQGNQAASYIARIRNANTGTDADGLLIDLGIAAGSRTNTNYYIGFAGAGTVSGKIMGGGASGALQYSTSGADYAEYFRADSAKLPQPGELVAFEGNGSSQVERAMTNGKRLVGVVSTNPGFVGNGPICQVDDNDCDANYAKYNVLVALNGQVPVKVNNENGPIEVGDPITMSSVAGVGTKLTGSGEVAGYAMEAFNGSTGTIRLLVRAESRDMPMGTVLQGSDATFSNLNVTGMTTLRDLTVSGNALFRGDLKVIGLLETASIKVNGHIITSGETPTFVALEAAGKARKDSQGREIDGTGAVVKVAGNDTSGTLTITMGAEGAVEGNYAKITFNKPFNNVPRVLITPVGKVSVALQPYVDQTATDLIVGGLGIPMAGETYSFNYFVVE